MPGYDYQSLIETLGFKCLDSYEVLQTLWGGYGELVRLFVDDTSVVVKHIQLPKPEHHPRGWNSDLSHQRKLRSYEVELNWYLNAANHSVAKVPQAIHVERKENALLIVMQDLQSLGYSEVVKSAERTHLRACLAWFAQFHAQHIGHQGEGLWEQGTYWHLDTRPDELAALSDERLKSYAHNIDGVLSQAPYQTLVHGDGKLANFCFTADGAKAAAVDFQYIGRGCAMKDIVLFMSSAVEPDQCTEMESWLLDEYFMCLKVALAKHQPELNFEDVEYAWRPLFAIAWADFQRFVKGWSPDHWKINPYTEQLTQNALEQLKAYP